MVLRMMRCVECEIKIINSGLKVINSYKKTKYTRNSVFNLTIVFR